MPDTFDEIESRFGAKKPAADFDAIEARFGKASAQDSFAADAAAEEALWAEDAAYPAMQRAKAAEEAAAAEFQRRAHAKTAGYKPPTFVERVGREALTLGQEGLDAGETAVRDLWAEAQAIPALIEGPARYQAARAQAHAADREKPTLTRALQDLDPTGGEAKARAASLAGLEGDTSGRLLLGGARLSGEVAALGPAGKAVGMVPTFTARAAAGAAPGDELKAALTTAATLIVGGKVAQGLSQVFPKIPVGLRPALAGAVEDARQAAIAGVAFGGVEAGRRAVTGEDQDAEAIAHAAGLGAFIVAAEGGGAGAARKAYVERYMAAKAEQVQRAGIRADVRRQMGEIDQRNADLRGVRDEMRAAVPKAALPAAPERPALTDGDGSIPAEVVRKTTYEETPQTPENVRAGQRVTPGAEVVPIGPRSGKPTKARRPTPELTVEQAGAVKAEALRLGLARPEEVISPERAKALMAALEAGATPQDAMQIVKDLGPVTRADGNVAEGYKPTAEVLADPAIPEAQKAAIKAAQEQGIATASSHVAEDGTGVAIGVDGQGRVRRVEAEAATIPSRGTAPLPSSRTPAEAGSALPGEPAQAPEATLGEALKKYGPQAPEKGTTLGVGLGAIPKGAADLPRNILNVPGKIIDPIVERGLDALGGLVGRGLRKIPGAGTVSGWWSARRNIQEVFAKQSGETEAAALDTSAATKAVAKATRAPEQQEAAYGYVTEPNSPVARAKAEKAIGPEGVKTIDAALDIRDTNQRFIEDHNLVGKEAKRVYGAQVGKRGTYLRREYANVEDEVYDHLLLLQGKGAKLPKNELKRDKWTVTWGAKEYRKFDTEAEARSFKKINGHGEVVAPLSPEARKQMGEVTDPAVVLQRTLALQALKIARFKTLEAFAKGPLASDKPGDPRFAAEPIPNDPTRYGPLAGKYVDKALRAEVMGRFGEVEALDKFFDIIERGGSWWKAGKTIYNPASQGGNIIGNIAFLERAGVSLARPSDLPHLANAIRLQFAKPGTAEWALLREFTRNGFGASASIPADLQGALLEAASVRNGQGMVRRIAAALARAPRAAWTLGDTIPKTAAALKVLRNGGTMEQAVQVVRDSFPDYGRAWSGLLTNSRTRTARAIKAVFAPPFVNFLSESVRIGAGTAKSKAGSLATGLLVLKALGLLSQQAAGISDEEAEKTIALAPDWMRAGSLAAPLWWDRDEKGNAQVVDLRYVLPLSREMGDLFGTGDARQSGLSIVNNPILAPLEDVFTNRDRFFGEPLTEPGASVEEKREQAGRYLFDAYAPSLATKFSGFGRRPGTSYRALTGTKDRYGQVPEVSSALMGDLAGVRVRPIDEGVEWARYRTALGARVREKVDAIRAADRRGDHDEVERLARDLRALDAEWKAKRKAVGK